jgi:hypothetical protein
MSDRVYFCVTFQSAADPTFNVCFKRHVHLGPASRDRLFKESECFFGYDTPRNVRLPTLCPVDMRADISLLVNDVQVPWRDAGRVACSVPLQLERGTRQQVVDFVNDATLYFIDCRLYMIDMPLRIHDASFVTVMHRAGAPTRKRLRIPGDDADGGPKRARVEVV